MSKEYNVPKHFNEIYFVIYTPKGFPDLSTVQYTKQICIMTFITDSDYAWEEWQAQGWSCQKVSIDVTLCNDKILQ